MSRPNTRPRIQHPPIPTVSFWGPVLAGGGTPNDRAVILAALPDAADRLRRLTDGLPLASFVGVANALFNKCDPTDLQRLAPGDRALQAHLTWSYLEEARGNPSLGGKWADCVTALASGADAGLARVGTLSLEGFVTASLRVVAQVYRKV